MKRLSIKKKQQQIFIYLANRSTIPAASILRNKHICCSLGGSKRLSSIDFVSGNIDLTRIKNIIDLIVFSFFLSFVEKRNMFTESVIFYPIGYPCT